MRKPKVFIGGASESDPVVEALAEGLAGACEVFPWRAIFKPGEYTLDALQRTADHADFAVMVFGREDLTHSRQRRTPSPRDNVVYEAGLFAGNLGKLRTFVVHAEDTKIPTDYLGVTMARFDAADPELEPVLAGMRERIAELGPRFAHRIAGNWWQLVPQMGEGSVVSFFEIEPVNGETVRIEGRSWDLTGKRRAKYWSTATELDERELMLRYAWEGEHPMEAGLPRSFGVGELRFDREPVTGTFSSTRRSQAGLEKPTLLRSAWYFRAPVEHARVLAGRDREAREALIREQLDAREDLWT